MLPSPKDIEWYHRHAGPVSFALEMDDRFSCSLERISRGIDPRDYLSHHFHPIRWRGASIPKKLYDTLQIYRWVHFILKPLNQGKLTRKLFRLLWGSGLLLSALAIYLLSHINLPLFLASAIFYLSLICMLSLWFYVQRGGNWEYFISRPEEWGRFLLQVKEEFERTGRDFPLVIRHGWNLPPFSSMEFYLSEMGVLADASATPTSYEGHPSVGGRGLSWKLANPYYAGLKGDYDLPWSGEEEDRGILELPVTLGNVACYGFGPKEKQEIDAAPDGGLVSIYIHPWDDFRAVKDWVRFLEANYDVRFVRADQYARMFLKKHPRPVLIDRELKAKWAFLRAGRLVGIREIEKETVSLELSGREGDYLHLSLEVNTESPLPLLGLEALEARCLHGSLFLEKSEGTVCATEVPPRCILSSGHSLKKLPVHWWGKEKINVGKT